MTKKSIYIIAIIFSILAGCKEEIDILSQQYEKLLVVDGMITNQPGPYTVKISYSSMVNDAQYKGLKNCKVTIEEENGTREVLEEGYHGIYETSPNGIQGIPGNSYRLIIETEEGKTYQTDYHKLNIPVEIDTITAKLEYVDQLYADKIPGCQFYISTEETDPNGSFIMWKMEETYEYTAEYQIDSYMKDGNIYEQKNKDSLYRCWRTVDMKEIFTENSVDVSSPRLKEIPLHFVSNQTKRLQYRYSLLVEQYTLSRDAYAYWDEIKAQLSGDNFLEPEQHYKLAGNVYNKANDEEVVLGHFTVAPIVKKRIFFDPPNITIKGNKCFVNNEFPSMIGASYNHKIFFVSGEDGFGAVNDICIDCRTAGGKLKKPDFWK